MITAHESCDIIHVQEVWKYRRPVMLPSYSMLVECAGGADVIRRVHRLHRLGCTANSTCGRIAACQE